MMDKTSAIDMEYNNYYPPQAGHHPPPVANQQHGGSQLQQPPQPPPGGQMLHAPMSAQNIRQAMPPGPQNHHQQQLQQQHQQHLGHHQQQMPPQQQQQQQQHPNYHQIQPPHPHGPPVSHTVSPHSQQQQQQHHNHQQPNLAGPPPQQTALPSQQHHMHSQSPHHHPVPQMHMQQQQQPLNQMIRPPLGPSVMNHPQQPNLQQHPHQHQDFFAGGPIPQSNLHHYLPHQNQHHPHHQPQPQHHHQQHHHHHHHQPPLMHHAPPLASHHPHIQQGMGRNSPFYPSILQTEFRIIELNRRLQCRPIPRHPVSPLPNNPYDDISLWWEKFASDFFEDEATLTIRIQDDKISEYTIGRTLIPRFFRTYFDGGVTDLSINLRNPKESCLHPHLITLNCDQAFIITNNIYRYPVSVNHTANQSVVVHTEGQLILDFVSNSLDSLLIKSWKFNTRGCREYIDRSMTAMGLPNNHFLVEPVTRQGLTKSTISYLKMCMIMEPMQDLMFQHIQTKMDPRSCLRKLLFEKFKYSSGEDTRVTTNKRNRKRKSSAAPATAPTSKKPKANVNNPASSNSSLNNNIMMSPSGPGFSLASQDVMVVGEPSMMGGDFGDDNERMITRLENTQYDPTASTPSNAEESDSMNASTGNDNGISSSNNIESTSIENHTLSPSLLQQRQQLQQSQQQVPPLQAMSQQQIEQSSPSGVDTQQQHLRLNIQEQNPEESASGPINQVSMIEHNELQQQQQHLQHHHQHQQHHEDVGQSHQSTGEQTQIDPEQIAEEPKIEENKSQHETVEEININLIVEGVNDSNLMTSVNTVCADELENHTNSIEPLNEESNSNSQLPCSTASATSAIEQQQPVDNGVA